MIYYTGSMKKEENLSAADQKIPVLIVDDNSDNLGILYNFLKNEGYKVYMAQSGEAALMMVKINKPSIILLDIMMPGLDGFQVCKKLKEEPETREIPVIFMSALTETFNKVKAFSVGGVDYVTKPFQKEEVLERIKNHITIMQQKKRLAELNTMKNKFLGMAAHDLRNPIAAINSLSRFLQEDYENIAPDFAKKALENISNSSRYALTLIEELLDITVIESGKFELKRESYLYIQFIKDIIAVNSILAEKKNISITLDTELTGQQLCFDINKIEQVLNNLITNAIKFSHPGNPVVIKVYTKENFLYTQVKDEGQGIAPHELEAIFIPFKRSSTKATHGERSTGLGLAISKRIINEHGGALVVQSEVGKGSTFTFFLPLCEDKPGEGEMEMERERKEEKER